MNHKPIVLITGAGGRIAQKIVPRLADDFELRLTDRRNGEIDGGRISALDLLDFNAVCEAVKSVDAVVHLAIASRREFVTDELYRTGKGEGVQRFHQATMEVNVRGTYHVFEGCRLGGCRRVVYGSSLTVLMGDPDRQQLHDDLSLKPLNFYAVSKVWGEQLGELYARKHGLHVHCLRLGTPHPQPDHHEFSRWLESTRARALFVTFRDMAEAVRCALVTPEPRFGAYSIVSQSDGCYVDVTNARKIGWQSRDFCHADGTITQREGLAAPQDIGICV